jgi:hypothetical protein
MNSQLLPSVAARELQTRRTIRRSLTEWCRLCGFEPAAHHRLIIEELEAVARGEYDRLAIFLPPGSAKSTYASVLFPPWVLANSPDSAIIAASHTQELAERWGRKVRNLILEHGPVLDIGLSPDSQAAGRWETMEGGEYFAAGVGGSITGRRADLVLIDDPVRSREDADSETSRERAWEWYRSDVLTRLKPGGRVVLIQTRWHEDDLAGRALADAEAAGRPFRVVKLPMEAEDDDPLGRAPGALLWPEYFTPEMAAEARRDARTWTALYQQRPAPEEGNYFKDEWLRPIDTMPAAANLRVYGASDYAVSAGKGDYTVHVVVGVDADQRMYLLDLWRRQATSDEWVESLCDLIGTWRPAAWAEEQGQIKAGVGPFLERRLKERQAFVYRQQFPTRGDKGVRAQSVRGRMAMNGLYVPRDAP